MKEWILSIGITVLLVSIITIILPNGKTGKFIKGMFSVMILLVTIKPLASINEFNFNDSFVSSNLDIDLQENYINYTFEQRKINYENKCVEILESLGINNGVVKIFYDSSSLKFNIINVKINLENSVINSDKEHIFVIEEVKDEISVYLNVNQSILVVYE